MVQPINYYESLMPDLAGQALKETQNRLGQSQLTGLNLQNQQMQQQMSEQQAFKQVLPGAINDPQKLRELAVQYPSQLQNIQAQLGFRSAQDVAALDQTVNQLQLAIATGDPRNVAAALVQNAEVIQSKGVSPQQLMTMYANNPEQFNEVLSTVKLGTLSAKDQFAVLDKKEGREIDRGKLSESIRSSQASESLQARGQDISATTARRGQDIQMRGQDISAENARLDREIKKSALAQNTIDRQLRTETNQIKRDDLLLKQQEFKRKGEQAKTDKYDTYLSQVNAIDQTIGTANRILDSPGFNGYFGINVNPFGNRYLPGTDAANTEALVDTLKSQTFLANVQLMKGLGALSNAEGQRVTDAIGKLSPSISEKAAKETIKTIISVTNKGKHRLDNKFSTEAAKYRKEQAAPSSNQSEYSSLWGD
ncbi:phage DNA ejection protein [Xenorhabdus bovienii]|uniref:phage DNA ejection protein n=1 Tax=Xenorhabdus bovienii TaxID=40576 RepID=UPI0023B2F8DC|nr:phage DNA ejection protein [Xenorhabdus bovienii]MDE9526368.1 DNA transfer protein [Xenorhabdus bovienii]MDE9569796.1 DNA transfer protein [Xenorhabdus bovienii]